MSMARRLAAIPDSVRPPQRTHGTTDPGGVWHPVHCRECLTILLGTYAENGQIIGMSTNCIVFGTACLCLHWQPPIVALTRSTIALERTGNHSLHALDGPSKCTLYKTDTGHRCT